MRTRESPRDLKNGSLACMQVLASYWNKSATLLSRIHKIAAFEVEVADLYFSGGCSHDRLKNKKISGGRSVE